MWGTAFLFTHLAVETIPPASVAAGRIGIGAVLLCSVVVALRLKVPRSPRVWLHVFCLGVLGNATPFFLISWGQQAVDSGLAGLFMGINPLVTLVLAHLFVSDERMTGRRSLGFVLGFIGVAVLMGPEAARELGGGSSDLLHQAAVLAGAACYAANNVLARRLPEMHAAMSSAGSLLCATLVIVPVALVVDAPGSLEPAATSVAAVLWLGVVATATATLVYFTVVRSAGATFLAQSNYLIPAVAIVAGITLLGEPVRLSAIVSLACIVGGIAIAQSPKRDAASVRPVL